MNDATASSRSFRKFTSPAGRLMWVIALAAVAGAWSGGCKPEQPVATPPRYPVIADLKLPAYLKNTIYEQTEVDNIGYSLVSSFGLVVNLRQTGDSTAPTAVKDWVVKEMFRHGFGSVSMPEFKDMSAERVLEDKRVAIVEVGGWIPPGARHGQQFDITVKCLAGNQTTSLARGLLYRTSLTMDGANRQHPSDSVNEYARAQGDIFVNPAYALDSSSDKTAVRASLRTGTIPGGGVMVGDRPIYLRLRHPSFATSRQMQLVINQRFQKIADWASPTGGLPVVALAEDEGIVQLFMPAAYRGDWEHFVGVTTHLFLYGSAETDAQKAQELTRAALEPGAPLNDISYCLEGLGEPALPYVIPLLSHPSPDVSFAAARACAFMGDRFAEQRLMEMARTPGHPYRVTAVRTLGMLSDSPAVNAMLVELLNTDEATVRIEAYKVLVRNGDAHIVTKAISPPEYPDSQFAMDLIDTSGPPLIYASRIGPPRVALFGRRIEMGLPVTFVAFDGRLSMTEIAGRPNTLNIYYRDELTHRPVEVASGTDVAELIARLGGYTKEGLHFSYGDMVAMLQSWSVSGKVPAAFVLQDMPTAQRPIDPAHVAGGNTGGGRPQGESRDHTALGLNAPAGRPQ